MSDQIFDKIGAYTIDRELGRGGMGVVYLGTDTRLDRKVAIKALPEHLAQDPERLARFEREAKVLASLSHPNVAGIHGVEEKDGGKYLVLEFVDGEDLAERLDRGPLDVDDAIDLATQIAAGVEAAHDAGIIHRDLKPANVIITPEGQAKVLDFGLARIDDGSSSTGMDSSDLTSAQTMDAQNSPTMPGVILGTAAYMSPEQARGRRVDKRTDVWSFGVVLYEMLAGVGPFRGETATDSIGAILHKDPDFALLPAGTPRRVHRVLQRCLVKDRRRRLRDVGDARLELEDKTEQDSVAEGTPALSKLRLALLGLLLVAVSAAGAIAIWNTLNPVPTPEPIRFEIASTEDLAIDDDPSNQALSPDGSRLAFIKPGQTGGLCVRSLSTLEARVLPGTEGAYLPMWSPDGNNIAFFVVDKLKRVPATGGTVVELCTLGSARGGHWGSDDMILFSDTEGPILKVSASGGPSEPVTTLDTAAGETAHRFPHLLPDGRRFLFTVLPPKDGNTQIHMGVLGSSDREHVLDASGGALYSNGRVFYERDGSLAHQQFDGQSFPLDGEPTIIRESMQNSGFGGAPGFSISNNGTVSYSTFNPQDMRVAWVDHQGREVEGVPIDPAPYTRMTVSNDARKVALVRAEGPNRSTIWIGDLERGVVARFSEEPALCESPRWSPDDRRIAYTLERGGPQSIVVRELSNPSQAQVFLESDQEFKRLFGWTPDGTMLSIGLQNAETLWDLWLLPLDPSQEPQLYLRTPVVELGSRISPDGRWMAYAGNESGQFEVYVQSYPEPGIRYQVTKGGGWVARWLNGGRQLSYMNFGTQNMHVADVLPGEEFRLGPDRLFAEFHEDQEVTRPTADGKRILALLPAGAPVQNTLTVVINGIAQP